MSTYGDSDCSLTPILWHSLRQCPAICEHTFRGSPRQCFLASLAGQTFSGLPQRCHTSPLRVSSWPSAPGLSLESGPRSLSLSIQPPLSAAGMQSNISGWEMLVSTDLCGKFSSFCLPSTCCLLHSPLKFQNTPHPCPQGSF